MQTGLSFTYSVGRALNAVSEFTLLDKIAHTSDLDSLEWVYVNSDAAQFWPEGAENQQTNVAE